MSDNPQTPDEYGILAAEYVLGLLDDDAYSAATRLRMADRTFAEAVSRWERHFAPLLERIAEEAPPTEIWPKLAARIDDQKSSGTSAPEAANENDRAGRWKITAFASSAIAACLLAFLILKPAPDVIITPPAATDQVFAQLSGDAEDISVIARLDAATGVLKVSSSGLKSGEQVPVLWVIPDGEKPRALGELPLEQSGTMPLSDGTRDLVAAGAILAVTMENPAAAPYSEPTSTPVASGKISKI